MASKKQKIAISKLPKIKDYGSLVWDEVLCPICMSIMIQPVSLPCHHDFCLCCFEDTMKNDKLACPLCQIRIGSWWRKAQMNGKHINEKLRKAIYRRFPRKIANKLAGIEEDWETEIDRAHLNEVKKEFEVVKIEDTKIVKDNERISTTKSTSFSTVQSKITLGEYETGNFAEKCQEIGSKSELNVDFTRKQFTCRIFPLGKKNRRKRENIYCPLGLTASRLKAEQLLSKLKDKEDYGKAVKAEQLRLDKEFAERLASGKLFTWPPLEPSKKPSPMDKYFKKHAEQIEPHFVQPKMNLNFATKEYTYKELILNKYGIDNQCEIVQSSFMRRNIQQMKRLGKASRETDTYSDSSDSIEVKPKKKKRRMNLHSQRKSKKALKNPVFKRFPSGPSKLSWKFTGTPPKVTTNIEKTIRLKRSSTDIDSDNSTSSGPFCGFDNSDLKIHKQIVIKKCEDSFNSSGPFYGFNNFGGTLMKNCKLEEGDEFEQKVLQEQLDLEFARKLQEDLDRAYNTRRSYRSARNVEMF